MRIKMAIAPALRKRLAMVKQVRNANPVWVRTLIQRICFVPARPIRIGMAASQMPYPQGRALRKAHQESYREWKDNFRANRPIVFWLTETLPAFVSDVIENIDDKWFDFTDFCDNYFIQRADRFQTGLKRWEHESADELMLQTNFKQFEDFVETVFAARYIRTMVLRERKAEPSGEDAMPWEKLEKKVRRYPLLRFKKYRNREYALQYLHEQMSLRSDEYDGADEIRRLGCVFSTYIWWTQVRPNRGESEEGSGLQLVRENMTAQYGEEERWSFSQLTLEEQNEYRRLMQVDTELEKEWADEDTAMLVRLVKERQNLWY